MSLTYETHVTDGPVRAGGPRLPGGEPIVFSPVTSTLILGERDAVLVDPPLTRAQTAQVGDWVADRGKNLIAIYSTHGHGDHWFGTAALLERFPGATAYATAGTIEQMHHQAAARERWDLTFPGQIADLKVVARLVPSMGLALEGHRLQPIEVGHTDTDATTVLYLPSIGLVAAGDVAYNGVHQYLLEGAGGGFEQWLAAIDRVESLRPLAVVAGHKNRDLPDDPAILDQTRRYLHDVIALLATRPSANEFYHQMIERHPSRINLGPVWLGATSLLSQ
jgi:glyoxylase-like metal-dependent hydrolase (beta-lactamase superfamily II)